MPITVNNSLIGGCWASESTRNRSAACSRDLGLPSSSPSTEARATTYIGVWLRVWCLSTEIGQMKSDDRDAE